jgi:heptosyltransferase I
MKSQAEAAARLAQASSVCIVCLGSIGDAVWSLPVVNALKDDRPERRVTMVVEPKGEPIVRGHAAIDDVIVFHRRRGTRGVLDLWQQMRRRRFDVTLNLYHLGKSIPPTLFSRSPVRVGLDRHRVQDLVWLASNVRIPATPRAHTQEQALSFLEFLEIRTAGPRWDLELSEDETAEQARFFEQFAERPVVAVVPASASYKKDWIADRYATVINALERDYNFRTMLIGGPGDRETAIARDISEKSNVAPVMAMADGIRRLLWLIDGSDLVIAPDTGPVHVARALNVPVIGLYAHTNPWRVGPYRAFEELWVDRYTEPDEAPDPSNATPKFGRMDQISVADVMEKVELAHQKYIRPRSVPGIR